MMARHQAFWDLHQQGGCVIPKPWDMVSAQMVAATALPVSGDFENGLAGDPGGVADTIRLAAGPLKTMNMAELAAMGGRRISTGSQIARLTHAAMSGDAMLEAGRG